MPPLQPQRAIRPGQSVTERFPIKKNAGCLALARSCGLADLAKTPAETGRHADRLAATTSPSSARLLIPLESFC